MLFDGCSFTVQLLYQPRSNLRNIEMTEEAKDREPSNPKKIGKITPIRAEPDSATELTQEVDIATEVTNKNPESEKTLLSATQLFLKHHGIRKSSAAVRDAVEMPHEIFSPKEAINALSNFGFKTSFGNISIKKLTRDFYPIIIFWKNGNAALLTDLHDNGDATILTKGRDLEVVSSATFEKDFSGYVIIAKELSRHEKEVVSGHWFFSSFRKSKWIYAQVMIAAMVSNFLSLSTALFTMTVYDRIIPNAAFESLIALSIGVVIALGFDFLIKGLRARFIDLASKRADLEISRRLFDRILTCLILVGQPPFLGI